MKKSYERIKIEFSFCTSEDVVCTSGVSNGTTSEECITDLDWFAEDEQ